jgi:outer membrane receptor protein involved in Fe transport
MKQIFVLTLLALSQFFLQPVNAQDRRQGAGGSGQGDMSNFSGTVRGRVIDASSGVPVEYANIVFYRLRDSSLVTGGVTDLKGDFELQKVPGGRYYVEVMFIGYQKLRIDNVMVTPRQPEVAMGEIKLASTSENLEAVVVTGDKKMIQHNLDKKVYNVGKDVTAEGGTALEIMQNIPSVEVDMEGNVSLRGSQNVTILVDGRPSTFSSIEEIPANIIESVEVVTNPSARYDPDGLSGLINIVLKKKRDPGYHGMAMINAGTGDKYNASLNFNYRQNKFNLFTNISYRQFRMTGSTFTDNVFSNTLNNTYNSQDQNFRREGKFVSIRGGSDYFINSSNTITLSGGFNTRDFDLWDFAQTDNFSELVPTPTSFFRLNDSDNGFSSFDISLNYKKNGKKQGQELTADAFYNRNVGSFGSNMNQWWVDNLSPEQFEKTNSDIFGNTITVQTDLIQPIGNGGRIEGGVKGVMRKQDIDYVFSFLNGDWQNDATRSNRFIYNEQLLSAYAIYSNTLGKFSYQGGIRAEQAFTEGEQVVNNTKTPREFFNLFPSAHIKWDINSKNSTQIAYSKRVSRPNSRVLNPFVNYSDPKNLSMGNPLLNPEFTNSLELSYFYNLPKTKFSATAYYRNTTDIISRYVDRVNNSDTLISTYLNINKSQNIGLEGVLTQNITNWWKINGSAGYFATELDAPDLQEAARKGTSWNAKATSTWNIGRSLEVQLNGNYRSPMISAGGTGMRFWESGGGQGKTDEMFWFDIGMRMQVLKKKGTITLRVSDVLKTMNHKAYTYGSNFTSDIERIRESRVIFLGFSYRINEFRQRREKRADDEGSYMDME